VRRVWDGLLTPLEGSIVSLQPLRREHRADLLAAARPHEIWRWLPHIGSSEQYFDAWLEWSLQCNDRGEEAVFATIERRGGRAVGSTRYLTLRPEHRGLEIGFTWLTPSAWRTGANLEAKLLMLEHAFERLGCVRVEFKTDARNERSRAALEALPAQFEGILRSHMIMPDIGLRDSAYYSVIERDWPEVRSKLVGRLASRGRGAGAPIATGTRAPGGG
jgi:RimJ/RimL family protein N-acetyltransferase